MFSSKLKSWLVIPALLGAGTVFGIFVPFQQLRDLVASVFDITEIPEEKSPEPAEKVNVEISETARKSLGLIVRRANLDSYSSTYEIPATIKSLPGAGDIPLSSRFDGMVTRVFVSEGRSVKAGDPLFEMELTGENLSRLQSDLLLAIRRNHNISEELQRLAPLVQQGGLANKRILELGYEQKQLLAEVDSRKQELLLLGLSSEQVKTIITDEKLIKRIVVCVPNHLLPPQINLESPRKNPAELTFVLEKLSARTGSIVSTGDELCMLAFHEILVVEGHGFEKDLGLLNELMANRKGVTISLGSLTDIVKIPDCELAFIGNHAKGETNTYPFFVYLQNQLKSKSGLDESGYLAWNWKPGQLGHVELPKHKYEGVIVLPRDAVAEDGISKFVFQWKGRVDHDHGDHDHEQEGAGRHTHEHEQMDEFVPVEVNVLFSNGDVVIVDPNGKLVPGTRIAFNNATQLLFSMQSGAGAHGHSHGHEH